VDGNRGRRQPVGARRKLNSANILGSVLLAGVIGAIFDSWLAFVLAAIVLVAVNVHSGDIRPGKGGW
jgi:hypothetical protein